MKKSSKISSDIVRKVDDKTPLVCPECGKEVHMKFIQSSMGLGVMGIPLYNYKYDIYAICPECHSLFAVDPDVAKVVSKREGGRNNCLL